MNSHEESNLQTIHDWLTGEHDPAFVEALDRSLFKASVHRDIADLGLAEAVDSALERGFENSRYQTVEEESSSNNLLTLAGSVAGIALSYKVGEQASTPEHYVLSATGYILSVGFGAQAIKRLFDSN